MNLVDKLLIFVAYMDKLYSKHSTEGAGGKRRGKKQKANTFTPPLVCVIIFTSGIHNALIVKCVGACNERVWRSYIHIHYLYGSNNISPRQHNLAGELCSLSCKRESNSQLGQEC